MKTKSFKESQARSLKTRYKKALPGVPFKQWVRAAIHVKHDDKLVIQCEDWLFNKKANCKASQKHIGRTNGKKKGSGGNEPKKGGKKY